MRSQPTPPLPVEGAVEVPVPIDRLWEIFMDVPSWPDWNRCIWRSRVRGGELRLGATLVWAFNPIRPAYLYKLPASAKIVEFEPHDRVTWEVKAPGFHALHSYRFAAVDREQLPLRLVGGGGGAGLPRHAPLLARALPLRVPRVPGWR